MDSNCYMYHKTEKTLTVLEWLNNMTPKNIVMLKLLVKNN